jgi:hypothetical protein
VAKKTLYQVLQVSPTAEPEVIKAACDAKLAALRDSAAPEVAAERIIVREAYELLADPVRRKLYDEKQREERFRAMSSGGVEDARPRPANARMEPAAGPGSVLSAGWIGGIALLLAVGVAGGWVWLDHKRKLEAHRLQEAALAEEARQKEEQSRFTRETVDWAKDRIDTDRRSIEERRQDAIRQRERRQAEYDNQRQAQIQAQQDRRREYDERRAQAEERRLEQEERRRAQQQVERDRRLLQQMEREHGMTIPR